MSGPARRVLVIGYGNPGRLDDGLGPALAERIEALALPGVTVESDYQLSVEHAEAVARHDIVVFADAHTSIDDPFSFTLAQLDRHMSFTSHSLAPQAVVSLAQDLFGAATDAYILAIRGHDFNEFGQRLSQAAQENLDAATEFLAGLVTTDGFAAQRQAQQPAASTSGNKDITCKMENM